MTVVDELVVGAEEFVTVPDVVLRVVRELDSPECDLNAAADLIELDPVLSVRTFQLANSALVSAREALSLRQAVVRLGASRTRNAVLTVGIMRSVPELPPPFEVSSFWRLGLGTAMCARHLATELEVEGAEAAYLAGLVCGLGDVFLALRHTERFRRAVGRAADRGYDQAIEDEFGVASPEVCARLLADWNLDPAVIDAVRHYRDSEEAEDPLLAEVVFAADRMCRDLVLDRGDPRYADRVWVTEISRRILERIEDRGYPDVTFFLLEQQSFLGEVDEFVRSTFSCEPRGLAGPGS